MVIDAVVGEPATPGQWHRSTADHVSPLSGTAGAHGFGVLGPWNVVACSTGMPQQLILYAIEVADVSIGLGLSAPGIPAAALVDTVSRESEGTDAG